MASASTSYNQILSASASTNNQIRSASASTSYNQIRSASTSYNQIRSASASTNNQIRSASASTSNSQIRSASASTSNSQIRSSSTSPPTLWDVFLSFRGKDTRYTFTDHLYKALHRTGIRTFRDDPELRSGEVISDSLIQAITESKTYVVVLSENYASSSWCLDELVEILDCYERMKRLVVPVFYNIDPSVVRHQVGSFKEALEKHQTRFVMEKVNKWRSTLKEVADFSGYHISKNRSQADVIDEVVDRISLEINPKTLYVAKYPVGLDSRVKEITALLNSDTGGIIRIGIHGMGGVGKTTLAKAVYNQNYQRFQGSSFLANVREASGTENGLVGLQHQLIVDVLKCNNFNIDNKDQGIELIRARICSKKVLIVIDDLDNPTPLEYLEGSFSLGSMIVITTRHEDLLDSIKVQTRYKANELDDDESHQLFAQHAFGENKIPHTFTEMSKEILQRAGGLPLALMVFGSDLLNRSEEDWRWFIDKLSRVPIGDIEKKLMISFDDLKSVDPMLQDIFLDIACFYIGWRKEEAAKILESCYTFVNRSIDYLIKRCLLTTNISGELLMHDLLRDMGRTIARNNSPDEPEKHSRLWRLQDVHSVLERHKGTEAIKGIFISSDGWEGITQEVSCAAETLKRMSKLRLLYLSGVNLTGRFEHPFEDLRWLRWSFCPLKCLSSDFYAPKLVTLELVNSQMRIMWELNMDPRVFENLRTLNMSHSRYLTSTPDFTRLPYLETLDLRYCMSLEEVHISIGSLTRLVYLNLSKCYNLKSLPNSICSLKTLEILVISSCIFLEALPTEFGNIESLKLLNASKLSVSKLPDSIGRLSNLVVLYLSDNENLETLPDSICNLRSLEILDVRNCRSIERLPNLSNLKQLKRLDLGGCSGLIEIQGLQELTSLRELWLCGCNSSLVAYILTERFFQIFSGFGHKIEIYIRWTLYPNWISQSNKCVSRMSLDLQPNAAHNFLAIILVFKYVYRFEYSVTNITSGFVWSDIHDHIQMNYPDNFTSGFMWRVVYGDHIVIVPRSIFSITNGDDRIELTSDEKNIHGIHLVYKTDITMISEHEHDSTIVNVEDERSNSSVNDQESNKNLLSLGSTTVNVEEERSYPSERSECDDN